jgi:glycosyltransferase involved in cell wall biosynthesis
VELKVVIGISAYNSERDLPKTVKPIKDLVDEVIVCDNGSKDATSKTAEALGCKVISLQGNSKDSRSPSLSLFEAALETKADVLITLLPGTTVEPADIENLASEIALEHSDIVVGTNQSIGLLDMEDSPIKAYSRNAFSKLSFSHTSKLKKARELGLEVSKMQVSSKYKGSSAPQQQRQLLASSPPPQKNRHKSGGSKIPSSILRAFLLKNVWFWRTVILVSGMVASALLLAYSVIFWYKIQTLGATMSVFPWLYYVYYTNTNGALIAFLSGLVPAIGGLIACGIVFFKWVFPEFQISLEVFRTRTRTNVPVQNIA